MFSLGIEKEQCNNMNLKGFQDGCFTETFGKRLKFFHDGGSYHIETNPFICSANQWAGFYMIGTSVMKELKIRFWCVARTTGNTSDEIEKMK